MNRLRRLHYLCDALVEERITPAQSEELQDLLVGHIDCRREYVRLMGLNAGLHLLAAEAEIPAVSSCNEGFSDQGDLSRSRLSSNSGHFAGAAAAVILAAGVAYYQFRARAITETPALAASAAKVATVKDPTWQVDSAHGGRITLSPGDPLPAGRVHLTTGLAEISWDSGARVIVQAPAEFEVVDASTFRFVSGKLSADLSEAPEATQGQAPFTVLTPGSRIVDLGTGFGLEIDDQNRSEVHTLSGSIEFNLGEGGGQSLFEGEARRAPEKAVGTLETVPFDPSRFPSDVNSPGASSKYVFCDVFGNESDSAESPAEIGSTAWEDKPGASPTYQILEGSASLSQKLLALETSAEVKTSRVLLNRDLISLAGPELAVQFEVGQLNQAENARCGLILGDGQSTPQVEVALSAFSGLSKEISVALRLGDETTTFAVPSPGVAARVQLQISLTDPTAPQLHLAVNGNTLDSLELPQVLAESELHALLFATDPSGSENSFLFDDFRVRKF